MKFSLTVRGLCFAFMLFTIAGNFNISAKQVKGKSPATANEPIRGVWLTNVASVVLDSRQHIHDAVELCAESGINNIYVVTWNRGQTLYPSTVMQKEFGKLIDERFKGRDPLKELIEEAHQKHIKVHAWFEFGFSSSYKEKNDYILKARPNWAAIDSHGQVVVKNGFQWMNGFNPEVQGFMLSLIKEVVNKYDVDGIQGDDRLPANPSLGGYDPYTTALYKKEHHDQLPPANYKDADWVNWRAGKLNVFMKKLHDEVKAMRPGIIISMAPSSYPWSKEEYLQDWPTWVNNHWVDYIIPQIYRYNIKAYAATLDENLKSIPVENRAILYPGVLLKVDNYTPDEELLNQTILENRKRGINGEVFFFYEGLKLHRGFFNGHYQAIQAN